MTIQDLLEELKDLQSLLQANFPLPFHHTGPFRELSAGSVLGQALAVALDCSCLGLLDGAEWLGDARPASALCSPSQPWLRSQSGGVNVPHCMDYKGKSAPASPDVVTAGLAFTSGLQLAQ